jgi:hypothetical protein
MRGAVVVLALVAAAATARAGGPEKAENVTKESARTAGHAARDGALTFGHTVRDFFVGGPAAAQRRWKADAAHTRADAHEGKARVKAATE